MANKTIDLARSVSSGSYIVGKIVCDATADYDQNNSDVTCRIYVCKGNDDTLLTIPTSGTWSYSMTINGKTFTGTVSKDVLRDWALLATVSVSDIAHNDDGTKSIAVSGYVTPPNSTSFSGHKTSGGGMFTLDTVPRASDIDSVTSESGYHNGKLTYKYTPKSSSFYNRLDISLNLGGKHIAVKSIDLGQKSATQQTATVTLSEDEQAIIYNAIPNTTEGILRFTFYTYSDSGYRTQVGNAPTKEIALYVPQNSNTLPNPGAVLSSVHSLNSAFDGLYIQGKSKVKATFAGKGKYGATIKSYGMIVEGKVYDSSDSYTSGYLTQYGVITVKCYATDSRGFTNIVPTEIVVVPYIAPKISVSECDRCDAGGKLSDTGTYLKIKAKRTYSKVIDSSGVQHNTCRIQYRYMVEGGTYSSWATILPAESENDDVEIILLDGTLSASNTFIVQIGVIDTMGEYSNTAYVVLSEAVFMHKRAGGKGMGLGKYCDEDDLLDVAWNARIRGELRLLSKGDPVVDFVTERGTKNGWDYIKRSSGLVEAWYCESLGDIALTTEMASGVYSNTVCNYTTVPLPSGLFKGRIYHASANVESNGYTLCQVSGHSLTDETVMYRIWSPYSTIANSLTIMLYCVGRCE